MLRSVLLIPMFLIACGGPTNADAKPRGNKAETKVVEAAPSEAPADSDIAVSWDGGQITYGELRKEVGGELDALRATFMKDSYDTQSRAAEGMMMEKLLEAEAKAQGQPGIEALLKVEIEGKTGEPTPEEIAEFYGQEASSLKT